MASGIKINVYINLSNYQPQKTVYVPRGTSVVSVYLYLVDSDDSYIYKSDEWSVNCITDTGLHPTTYASSETGDVYSAKCTRLYFYNGSFIHDGVNEYQVTYTNRNNGRTRTFVFTIYGTEDICV